jgi:hypothetical protein
MLSSIQCSAVHCVGLDLVFGTAMIKVFSAVRSNTYSVQSSAAEYGAMKGDTVPTPYALGLAGAGAQAGILVIARMHRTYAFLAPQEGDRY